MDVARLGRSLLLRIGFRLPTFVGGASRDWTPASPGVSQRVNPAVTFIPFEHGMERL